MENTNSRSSSSDEELLLNYFGKRKAKGKAGRKSQWSEVLIGDLVDIILNNQTYVKRLIVTNTKNTTTTEIYQALIREMKLRCADRDIEFTYTVCMVLGSLIL